MITFCGDVTCALVRFQLSASRISLLPVAHSVLPSVTLSFSVSLQNFYALIYSVCEWVIFGLIHNVAVNMFLPVRWCMFGS